MRSHLYARLLQSGAGARAKPPVWYPELEAENPRPPLFYRFHQREGVPPWKHTQEAAQDDPSATPGRPAGDKLFEPYEINSVRSRHYALGPAVIRCNHQSVLTQAAGTHREQGTGSAVGDLRAGDVVKYGGRLCCHSVNAKFAGKGHRYLHFIEVAPTLGGEFYRVSVHDLNLLISNLEVQIGNEAFDGCIRPHSRRCHVLADGRRLGSVYVPSEHRTTWAATKNGHKHVWLDPQHSSKPRPPNNRATQRLMIPNAGRG
jgi:hypothetical protein